MKILPTKPLALGLILAAGLHHADAAFKVVGYEPSWQGSVSSIQFSKVTHINYAFVLPNANGSLQALDNTAKLQSLVTAAHNAGVKVSISVGGWNDGNDSAFVSLAGNSTARTAFVNNLVNLVNQYSLDGVDIDWEYPDTSSESSNYTTLMSQLATAMHSRGKLLTAAVIAQGSTANFISSSVFSSVDWLNLMNYDNNDFQHSTYSSAVSCLDYWINTRGLPASKAVQGVPFYSRPGYFSFAELLAQGASATSDTFNGEGYNGITTIKNKTNLEFDRGGGGMMFWELSQDATGANSLVSAIDSVVKARSGGNTGGIDTAAIYQIQNLASGLVLNQQGSLTNGSAITQWSMTSTSDNLRWKFIPTSNGYYQINSVKSGKDAVVQGASTTSGAKIIQWSFGSAGNDQWKPVQNADGTYTFLNLHSGLVLEDPGSSTATSTQMDQGSSNSGNNQKWKLLKQ
jgi:chitinase